MKKPTVLLWALLGLVGLTPTVSDATSQPFNLTGNPGSCGALTSITNGCRMLIAGTYTDFIIQDISATNMARIDFVQGSIDKLTLTGAKILPLSGSVSNISVTFTHQFSNLQPAASSINNTFAFAGASSAGGPAPDALGDAALCIMGVCPIVDNITSSSTHKQFSTLFWSTPPLSFNLTQNLSIGGLQAANTAPFLGGEIDIDFIASGQQFNSVALTLKSGANLPPILGTGCMDAPALELFCYDVMDGNGLKQTDLDTIHNFDPNFNPVPEPTTLLLFVTGLAGILWIRHWTAGRKERVTL